MAQALTGFVPPARFHCTDCSYATSFEAGAYTHSKDVGHFVTGE